MKYFLVATCTCVSGKIGLGCLGSSGYYTIMKGFFVLSLFVLTASIANSSEFSKTISKEWIEQAAYGFPDFWQTLFETLTHRHAGSLGRSNDALAPVIPPQDDPLILDDPLNFTIDIGLIKGDGSFRGAIIEGLSTLEDDLTTVIVPIPLKVTVNYKLDLTSFSFYGDYDADLIVDLTSFGYPVMDLKGGGEYFANVSGVFADVSLVVVQISLTKVTIQSLSLNPGFQAIDLFFQNAILNGDPIDYWDEINKGLKAVFDYAWPENKNEIQEAVRGVLNFIIEDCTILQLLALIDGTGSGACLKFPSLPTIAPPTEPPGTGPTNAPPSVPTNAPPSVPTNAPPSVPTNAPPSIPSNAPPSEVPSEKPTEATTEAYNGSNQILLATGILVVAFIVSLIGI